MEQTSIQRIQQMHPAVRDKALAAYKESVRYTPVGIHPFVIETMRTFARSAYLYQLGRSIVNPDGKSAGKPMGNIVTNAHAGQSYHNYGLALDIMNQVNGEILWKADKNFQIVVDIFKSHGWTWGGDFRTITDTPHFEMTLGHNWRDLLTKHNAGNVDKDGFVILN